MPTRDIKDSDLKLQAAWMVALASFESKHPNEPQPFLTCVYRSNEEQNELYAQGRTKQGSKVTNARGGQSKHNSKPSKAFDIAFKGANGLDWSSHLFVKFAEIIKPLGIKWGGDFKSLKDMPHFEI